MFALDYTHFITVYIHLFIYQIYFVDFLIYLVCFGTLVSSSLCQVLVLFWDAKIEESRPQLMTKTLKLRGMKSNFIDFLLNPSGIKESSGLKQSRTSSMKAGLRKTSIMLGFAVSTSSQVRCFFCLIFFILVYKSSSSENTFIKGKTAKKFKIDIQDIPFLLVVC